MTQAYRLETPEEAICELVIQGLSQGNWGLHITRPLFLALLSGMDMNVTMVDTDLLSPSCSSESSISGVAALCGEMTLCNEKQNHTG